MIFLSRYLGYKGVLTLHPKLDADLTLHPKLDADLLKERKAFDVDESKRAEKCKQGADRVGTFGPSARICIDSKLGLYLEILRRSLPSIP